ncbi:hypothetical protein GCM10017562_69550 [Streptomyces roseofulvus]
MIRMDARFPGITELTEVPSVAVVVDVMRAYTVAAWAFARGAEKIVLAASLDDAMALKARHPEWWALKDGPPAPGFDLVNSPALLRSTDLTGRTVVQKTTAGTVGALAVKDAELVLCAGFVVAEATARTLRARAGDTVTFVVTGEDGRAEEDLACAQYIAARATDPDPPADAAPAAAADTSSGGASGPGPRTHSGTASGPQTGPRSRTTAGPHPGAAPGPHSRTTPGPQSGPHPGAASGPRSRTDAGTESRTRSRTTPGTASGTRPTTPAGPGPAPHPASASGPESPPRSSLTPSGTDPTPYLRRAAASRAAVELARGVRAGAHPDDVALCLQLDRFAFAMVATVEDALMVLRPYPAPPLPATPAEPPTRTRT